MLKAEKQGRYLFREKILSTPNGEIYGGQDLSLRRDVLLFRVPDESSDNHSDILFNLSHASGLTGPQFLHILDMNYDQLGPYAVLEKRQGQLLNHYLMNQRFSIWNALRHIYNLGIGLLEASEERIRGFSVAADNLWFTDDQRLIVINYWSRGSSAQTGVKGLIHLLYELTTSSMVVVGGYEKLEHSFRSALRQSPTATTDALLHLLKQTYLGQYALSSFIADLAVLLKHNDEIKENQIETTPQREVKEKEPEPLVSTESSDLPKPPKRPKSFKKKSILLTFAGLVLFVGMFTFVRHILITPRSATTTQEQTAPQPKKVEVTSQQTTTPAPAPAQAAAAEDVEVPNLQGLSQADAEKQALSLGLHYQFFIEANQQTAGTVFKQDIPAGKKVPKETTISFWISKGNG